MNRKFHLGLLINPLAGLGGSVALKGSDHVAELALALGATPKANERMAQALVPLLPYKDRLMMMTGSGALGADVCERMGFSYQVVYHSNGPYSAADTQQLIHAMMPFQLDLLLFAGGDGTARDVLDCVPEQQVVLGVPAGVKIHSGVYGITPSASGTVVAMLLDGQLVNLACADVMDIDEVAFRGGQVRAKRFGELLVPAEPRYIQAVKMGGKESDDLVLADIAADVIEQMDDEYFIMGSGSTVAFIMEELGIDNTLLGVDVIADKQHLLADATAEQLVALAADRPVKLVITLIGGQGHILGRGNQQLSAEFIKRVGRDNIIIVATKTKLKALEGRPLIVDSGDPELDQALAGFYKVTTGYHDYVMYQVANPE
ncbi:ATP-NAD kinase family protein [Shewanella sp. NIFS-20-20]|uniref:ATP-NAD kinase family protein n=1 Tax=Shewanella sp. NIFS-20-20 TaxID=2853806 RepID=UPI001C45E181|nr:ATP-NAD kinase family protein [Shewanella sp. NIFS-20-20]MBV7315018.1 ATP-NAD kinase family protein [Shewanella sp. NIFS-20-20]